MKKFFLKLVSGFIISVATVFAILCIVRNSKYVYIGDNVISKKTTDVTIDFMTSKIGKSLNKLKSISRVEKLRLEFVSDDDDLRYIPKLNNIKELAIACSEINNATFLNSFEAIQKIHIVESTVDFQDFSNPSLKSLEIYSCKIINFQMIGKVSSLENLEVYQSNLSNQNEDMVSNELDSEIFSGFDYISSLKISKMNIMDIGGFLKMKSLNNLEIDKECITEEQVAELKEAGITVEIK